MNRPALFRLPIASIFCFLLIPFFDPLFAQTTVTYTVSGASTWTVPSCVTSVTVQCWGGGGGGASNNGGGGGGGAYSASTLTITPGSTYTLNVGAGGSGGGGACSGTSPCAAGGLGGDTWFSLNGSVPTSTITGVLAKGGNGSNCSQNSTTYSTVAGGQSSSGYGTTNKYNGGSGGSACVSCGVSGTSSGGGGGAAAGSLGIGANGSNGASNSGGTGATGTGGGGNGGTGGAPNNCGSSGIVPGGGGGGGGYLQNPSYGGYGANGQVKITYTSVPTISLTSSAGTNAQTACANSAITPITYSITSSATASVTTLPTGVTSSYSSGVFTMSGTPTVAGSYSYTISTVCSSVKATGTINVLQSTGSLSYWIGNTSAAWATSSNWCGSLPSCSVNAVIPSGVTNSPSISASGAACLSLTINSGATLTMSTTNTLGVCGNWVNNGTFTAGSGNIYFNGTTNQTIGGSNSTTFYNLTLNNTGTSGNNVITLSKPTTVSNGLTLTDGILATSATNLLTLTNSSSSATTGGNSTGPSFVDGPMRWNGLNGAGPFIFPTGDGTKWARVAVSGVTAATDFTAQHFNSSYANVSSSYISANALLTLAIVSNVEYWDVARTSGTGNAAVTLYWENALNSHITSCLTNGFLKVGHFNTGTSKWENANSSGTVAVTGSCLGTSAGTVKSDVMTSFSPFSFGSGSSGVNPLPIELLSFNAVFNGKTIDLKWATASEINNNYFTVERSTDGVDFTIVGIVASKALNGHSTSILDYTLNDPNTETGTYYYRLKQTDFDYKYVYSDVVVANITESVDFTFDMIPNPNDGNQMAVHITTPQSGTAVFKIYDLSGKLLFTENTMVAEGDNNSLLVRFKETLNSGTYIVTVAIGDNLSKKKRMVVIR